MKIRKPGDKVIFEVEDAEIAQKLIDSKKWEEYVAVDEKLNPDGSVDKIELKGEDLNADIAALEAQAVASSEDRAKQIVSQYNTEGDAEVAELARVVAPVMHKIGELPDALAKSMDRVLKQQTPITGGIEELKHIARQVEAEKLGIKSPTDRIGLGTWNRKQANLYYTSVMRMMNGMKPLAAAEADPLVMAQLQSEFSHDDSVRLGVTEGTGSAGGYLVPEDHKIEIIKGAAARTQIWPVCSVRPTSSDVVRRPVRNNVGDVNYGADAADELENVTEVAISWTEYTWTMRSLDAYFPVSVELMNDAAVNVEGEITEAVSEQFAEQHEKLPIQGRGASHSQATGLMNQAGILSTPVGAALTVALLLDVVYDINIRYRNAALSDLLALLPKDAYLAVAIDASQNYRNLEVLQMPKLLENEFMTKGNVLTGAFNNYWIYQNPQMQLIQQMIAKSKGLDMVFWERWDGRAVHTAAFRKGTGITY